MSRGEAAELAARLSQQAETVCRHYLPNGRRQGGYWVVGDARNTPGRSMFVRLKDNAKGPAGKWQDAATGEHGDLLDVIGEVCNLAPLLKLLTKLGDFTACRSLSLSLPLGGNNRPRHHPARARRHGGFLPWRSRSQARW